MLRYMLLILAGLTAFQAFPELAEAQDYDARWRLGVFGGWNTLDSDRHAHDDTLAGFGVGRRFGPRWSVDFEFESYNTHYDDDYLVTIGQAGWNGEFRVKQYHFAGRYFFREGAFQPYLVGTLGLERTRASHGSGEDPVWSAGFGLIYQVRDWLAARTQVVRRFSYNDRVNERASHLQDTSYRLDLVFTLPW